MLQLSLLLQLVELLLSRLDKLGLMLKLVLDRDGSLLDLVLRIVAEMAERSLLLLLPHSVTRLDWHQATQRHLSA